MSVEGSGQGGSAAISGEAGRKKAAEAVAVLRVRPVEAAAAAGGRERAGHLDFPGIYVASCQWKVACVPEPAFVKSST